MQTVLQYLTILFTATLVHSQNDAQHIQLVLEDNFSETRVIRQEYTITAQPVVDETCFSTELISKLD